MRKMVKLFTKFAEWPEIDYKRGLIILDDKEREYVRLW